MKNIGDTINTVGELKDFLSTLNNDDQVCLEMIDLKTGDVEDLFPFYMDVINGIKLLSGKTVSEVRFCQKPNS